MILTKVLNMKIYQFGLAGAAVFWEDRRKQRMVNTNITQMLWELIYQ